MSSDYALASDWTVACSRDELWAVLDDLLQSSDPMAWWPAVHVTDYDKSSMGVRVSSGLGYALRFTMRELDARPPTSLTFSADGDLRGAGSVMFHELGADAARMEIVWKVSTGKPWMRWSGWLLRPVFVAGHRIVMRRGERQLNAWIARRT